MEASEPLYPEAQQLRSAIRRFVNHKSLHAATIRNFLQFVVFLWHDLAMIFVGGGSDGSSSRGRVCWIDCESEVLTNYLKL